MSLYEAKRSNSNASTRYVSRLVLVFLLIAESSAYLPPPDVSNISLRIHNDVCRLSPGERPILGLVLVVSHAGNLARRTLTRRAYPADEIRTLGYRRLFVLGSLRDNAEPNRDYSPISQAAVREENREFSDVLQFDYTEEYRLLPVKTLLMFTWAKENCAHARFVVSVDDDTFVEYYSLASYLKSVGDEGVDDIRGDVYPNNVPVRTASNPKYYVSLDEYPEDTYPEYVSGPFYVTSSRTVGVLAETALTTPYNHISDIYFTGIIADKANINRLEIQHMVTTLKSRPNCCVDTKENTVYACKVIVFAQMKPLERNQALQFREHGKFCYFFVCKRYWEGLENEKGIVCV